ncbi:M14 family metallopeptidase [Flaviaesturariibacter aridisoli]|uniref:Zinc carboxypeptidase n=1 Tax=Flaviaesturariibacter aridisoli TaxID=2545761 RepID=A0A4R4E418_9BACT|nr:M14 family metallopeptidase [Flaviaesturariibacter aridisoli]TCZ71375.1 zinc carboxypeptidase [Flaviaesturariibacter aridisoli]
MRRSFLLVFLCSLLVFHVQAQLQSPDAFLGYPLGTRYTPHHRIVSYFQAAAQAAPAQMRLVQYGSTNEGRPLLLAAVSSAENIARLDAIRANNRALSRTGEGSGSAAGAPVVVWLSYNVHGNEPSSSEAALKTLYTLLSRGNGNAQEWLKNTVVLIDPCLNPDGRDRYVNWFNSVVGKGYDATLSAREHREPWPGGRVNHYYFDLNRDWAWQTQVESQARLKVYQEWMPQVHVDFHEQGINNPYYFAPAAEPYHEVITPWQRRFQEVIGRNHAKYFDQQGWLYFTREVFDLFYPAYGDTYPLYNGAIGMTYEQGGGPAGGLAAVTNTGDTLKLTDRIEHHFTTGMSTIETASKYAADLVKNFQDYFTKASNGGYSEYANYIIKHNDLDEARILSLRALLQKNNIQWRTGLSGSMRGFNYSNGRQEAFRVTPMDMIIPAHQAQGSLLRVLFEPNPKLSDSVTYDITAWALPYVYGLQAYATNNNISGGIARVLMDREVSKEAVPGSAPPFGYVVAWDGVASARFAGKLLQQGYRIRFAQKDFTSNGKDFRRGSLILLRNGQPEGFAETVRSLVQENKLKWSEVSSGLVERGLDFGSSSVRPLAAPHVALIAGEGSNNNAVGEVWHFFEQELDYPVSLINSTDFGRTDWSQFQVVILPNGNYRFLSEKVNTDALRSWVSKGGRLIALEGAVAQLAGLDWGLKQKKAEEGDVKNTYANLRRYEDRERDEIPNFTPGSIYRVELDNTHPLAFGYPGTYYTLRQDDRSYEFLSEGGWNVGVVKKDRPLAGFVGNRLQPRLQDALILGVQELGAGQVIYFTDDVLFRSFWENGKLLMANAVFLVGQ